MLNQMLTDSPEFCGALVAIILGAGLCLMCWGSGEKWPKL
jgi:hypothetical protein